MNRVTGSTARGAATVTITSEGAEGESAAAASAASSSAAKPLQSVETRIVSHFEAFARNLNRGAVSGFGEMGRPVSPRRVASHAIL